MANKLIEGAYAALLTPRLPDGRLDDKSLVHLLHRLSEHRLRGFVINGATGEFCLTRQSDLKAMLEITADLIPSDTQRLCGVGSTSIRESLAMADAAAKAGAVAVLAPPPYFFPYQQDDVASFLTAIADNSPLPVLLYNLPQFTSPIETDTATRLISEHPNIIGIKDSSGSLAILQALTDAHIAACRIVGNDGALIQAQQLGVCDAVISGVAGVLPELISAIFYREIDFEENCRRLSLVLERIAPFPTPWGLKWLAEARQFAPAVFAQILSPQRKEQGYQLQRWFEEWWAA